MDDTVQTHLAHTDRCRIELQKLIRMNMPIATDETVHFKTTMFALVRESLSIKTGQGKPLNFTFF